jgi:phosphonate degradation associated HDIG domain protein
MTVSDEIRGLFANRGAAAYFGEAVTQLEHALQAAHFAAQEGAPPTLVVAALLHDVGHLVEQVPDDLADWREDAHHERIGGAWLARRFGPEVSDPVRLHVPAKRYLCATDPSYLGCLSPASVHTLRLQGGPMSPAEVAAFEREPSFREAVRVRRWDDAGKVHGLVTRSLESYFPLVESLAGSRQPVARAAAVPGGAA